jgi:hypothetical protein
MNRTTQDQTIKKCRLSSVLSRSFQYLYFIRFSIAFWLFIPMLAIEDDRSGISAITRGIFTPARFGQFLGSAFFIVCVGMVALLTARLVCLNGKDRFETPPPSWIAKSLGSDSDPWAGRILLIVQAPGLLVILYLHVNARRELSVSPRLHDTVNAAFGSLIGIALALLFWWIINALDHWSYSFTAAKGPARTLLYPNRFFFSPYDRTTAAPHPTAVSQYATDRLPWLITLPERLWRLVARLGAGYADPEGNLWEGHRLAAIALAGYIGVYIVLFPLTAPAPQKGWYGWALGSVAVFFAALSSWIFLFTKPPRNRLIKLLRIVLICMFAVVSLAALRWMLKAPFSFQGFPILGSVLVLTTMLAFIFSAVAFWADRHRIPVLTAFVLYLYLSHTLISRSGESYFRARELKAQSSPPIPAEILQLHRRMCSGTTETNAPCPVIFVTATGGGIHAAAWTAMVLTELELKMQNDDFLKTKRISFHNQLLYLSAVSGGSVGVIPFLREYYSQRPFTDDVHRYNPDWAGRIRRAANCSSLEAVGWGLEYSDFVHLVIPFLPTDPDRDRSVALEQAFARNVTSQNCDDKYPKDSGISVECLTLAEMVEDLRHAPGQIPVECPPPAGMVEDMNRTPGQKRPPHLPAFTFNATAAETGGRFLLSNYVNPGTDNVDAYPQDYGVPSAESFLSAYGSRESQGKSADIGLVTAARLSATFPYVSSAARIDPLFARGAYHFVDGGYIDNDGISSAIEFLESAFKGSRSTTGPVPVLFIEIRDSADLDTVNEESFLRQQPRGALVNVRLLLWSLFNQLAAPPRTFWQSGHVSVTRRNRRELESLMSTLSETDQASFTHIVFDYTDPYSPAPYLSRSSAQPLSWHLTPSQVSNISAAMAALQPCTQKVLNWAQRPPSSVAYKSNPAVICNQEIARKRPLP